MVKKKSAAQLIMGILLCAVSVICAGVLVYSICESASEKARLEAIGATVKVKLSALFFVDIAVFIISGLFGISFTSQNIGAKFYKEDRKETEIIPLDLEDASDKGDPISNDAVSEDKKNLSHEKHIIEKSRGVIINYGTSAAKSSLEITDDSSDSKSGESSSGNDYFSTGGDL